MSCINLSLLLINLTPFPWSNAGQSGGPAPSPFEDSLAADSFEPLAWNLCPENGVYPSVSQSYYVGPQGNSTLKIDATVYDNGGNPYAAPSYTVDGLDLLDAPSGTSIRISKGEVLTADDDSDYWAPVILAGGTDVPLSGSRPPVDWMQQSLEFLGCLPLKDMVIPGTHDSGMSVLNNPTDQATNENTQTQYSSIEGQLQSGARFFDIRPAIKNGEFVTAHWTKIDYDLLFVHIHTIEGGNGQSIASIVQDINAFTSANKELVILSMSNFINWDTVDGSKPGPFTDAETLAMLELLSGINDLYVDTSLPNFATVSLDTFIGNGRAAVLVVFDNGWEPFLSANNYLGNGFFIRSTSFPLGGSFADTNNLEDMRRDQYTKLQEFSKDSGNADVLFEVSWTYSLNLVQLFVDLLNQAFDPGNLNWDPIERGALDFNAHMTAPAAPGSDPWDETWLAWTGANGRYPNIIIVDYLGSSTHIDNNFAAMCLGLSRFKAGDRCVPALPPPSTPPVPQPPNNNSSPTPGGGSPSSSTMTGGWHQWGGWGSLTTMVTSVIPTSSGGWEKW